MFNGKTVLVGEDEPEVRSYLEMALRCSGYSVELAENGREILDSLRATPDFSAVLLDIVMPEKDGLETLREIRQISSDMPVIMISGQASPPFVMEAIRSGANDFLEKPVSHEDLSAALRKALAAAVPATQPRKAAEPRRAAAATVPDVHPGYYIGESTWAELESVICQVGPSDVPVLINGETGTGKEVLARILHARSSRASGPFIKLNCAALPSELVESELFGYERGAFTGAFQKKAGMFELADGGTLMLDEIGDMDVKLQAKLLQVLQDQEFRRIGGKDLIQVNVRVIAATHRDLDRAIASGNFREDLYYRLSVVNVQVPSLRQRSDEIIPMTEFLLRKHAPPGTAVPALTPPLREALLEHDWPGNIRELDNFVRRFLVFRDAEYITADLRSRARKGPRGSSKPVIEQLSAVPNAAPVVAPAGMEPDSPILQQVTRAKQEAEIHVILEALNSTRWNRKQAAAILKIDYKALLYKMKKLRIEERA